LGKIRPSRSLGPDGIPSFLLKGLSSYLTPVLTHIFNLVLKTNTFPEIWKKSYIIPVFKSGCKNLIKNYRPVNIQCALAKVFEKLLHQHFSFYFSKFLIENQHGFIKGRSIDTNLIVFSDFVANSLNRQKQVDTIYIDFSKAFDSIDHEILLLKLKLYGFSFELTELISSYLKGRNCEVSYLGHKSRYLTPTSGVPQGSVLGPLLFNIFINDIGSNFVNTNYLLFADDLKIFKQIDKIDDSNKLKIDLENLVGWCNKNNLNINVSKSFAMTYANKKQYDKYIYAMNHIDLPRVKSVKDLGVYFTSNFKFTLHVSKIINNAVFAFGRFKLLCREFNNLKVITRLFKSLIWSKIEFGSLIWEPWQQTLVKKCESINKKFIRLAIIIYYN